MIEFTFEQAYSVASRLAAVRAATIAARYGLPPDVRDDLQQEILLELWRKHRAYDPLRGSWRTFAERIVANRMASLVRRMYSECSGQFREDPLGNFLHLAAPDVLEAIVQLGDGKIRAIEVKHGLAFAMEIEHSLEQQRRMP